MFVAYASKENLIGYLHLNNRDTGDLARNMESLIEKIFLTNAKSIDNTKSLPVVQQSTLVASTFPMEVAQKYSQFYCMIECGTPSIIFLAGKGRYDPGLPLA